MLVSLYHVTARITCLDTREAYNPLDRGGKANPRVSLIKDSVNILHEGVADDPGIVRDTARANDSADASLASAVGSSHWRVYAW